MTDRFFLGVDTGATKSHAVIADGRGRVLAFAAGGPGNWESVGWEGAQAVLADIMTAAARQAGVPLAQIAAGGFGLAGYDWPEDHAPYERILRELGLICPLALFNDAFVGLPAGAPSGWGVVVSAGTSCNCYGRDALGRLGRATGNSAYGEYGGASELVAYGLQAVAREWTRRGPDTGLSRAFVTAAGAVDVPDLLAGCVRGRYELGAAAAPVVFDMAAKGDAVAQEAVTWAGQGLGSVAQGVIRQLDLQQEQFLVVLSGSFFKGSVRLQELVGSVVQQVAPMAQITRLNAHPVAGSVLLAMEEVGPVAPAARAKLLAGLGEHTEPGERSPG